MPVETEVIPFLEWLPLALLQFGIAIGVLLFLGTFFSYVAAAVRLGPVEAFYLVARILLDAIPDFLKTSPRRVYALARLAVQESYRRKVLWVFGMFVLVLLIAGWYLDTKNDDPARLYISFVLNMTNRLMLLLGFVLSAFSLPADIKSRTMYTITTKPVRALEIVLGRFLGFAAWGTVLIAAMCAISYVFVTRGLAHGHQLEGALVPLESPTGDGAILGETGESTQDMHHRHEITLNKEGIGRTDVQMGHWHEVRKREDGTIEIGRPEGMLTARVPLTGTLEFRDRQGRPSATGINVGNEWGYRSYIEGESAMRAIWSFDGVTPERFPEGLPIEMTIRVFRSHKGDIEQGIGGTLRLIGEDATGKIFRSEEIYFTAQEFRTLEKFIPRKLRADDRSGGQEIDLFDDLVHDGKLKIEMRCTDPAQYFGMARRDLYLHAADRPFLLNFMKGYFDLWLKMMIAIAFGTMFSTFLNGPVAMLAAVSCMVIGFVSEFIFDLAEGTMQGGGPIESFYRLVRQDNMTTEMGLGRAEFIIKGIDGAFVKMLEAFAYLLPNYSWFDTIPWVAYGMNIDGDKILQHTVLAVAYCAVALCIGYFFMKTREIAAD